MRTRRAVAALALLLALAGPAHAQSVQIVKTGGSSGSSALTFGTTTTSGFGTATILRNNAGVLGEYTTSGSGTVVPLLTSPQFVTPNVGAATGTSLSVTGNITLQSGTSSTSAPALLMGSGGFGLTQFAGGILYTDSGANHYWWKTQNLDAVVSGNVRGWTSSTVDGTGTVDVGLSRDAAGVLDVGTGAQGSTAGTIKAATHTAGTTVMKTGVAFAALGTPTDGAFLYCSDCKVTTAFADQTCTNGGSGAMAFRMAGAWKCME